MPGPMQWTPGGMVPAVGVVPNAGVTKDAFVAPTETAQEEHWSHRLELAKPRPRVLASPQNVVALAKARLREVKVELRRLKALEKEKGELERLIAAAKSKPQPRSNLREIKKAI